MSFFDLSIPYVEKTGAPALDNCSRRDCRLRTVARTMELGYTAIAYDRPFRGVLSDADRCQIAPFPAQSFLDPVVGCSPAAFTVSVALHRDLLGVPRASQFRQYTRITVSVDSAAAASALNSGNRLLRSYDLVAARPVNQMAFDQACNASEVDIISLDFSQKLPFRLKLAMVQAAVKRGVHFEISYSHIIAGGHARRQILSEAKRLGEWTRGKNLIISGSAMSLNEVRGPRDVANLSAILLGLTMERAKAAISGNCRSLVSNALRKKNCYFKEAIKIERILPEEKMDSQGAWFKEWNDWDPISSGENDLPSLDDMAKLFSAASKHSKSQNAIDFTSSINGMAPNASIFSSTYNLELDSADGNHPSDELEQRHYVDHVSAENVAAMVDKSVLNTTNEETKPCLDENGMGINVFENPSWSISDDLSLTGSGPTGVYGAGMINTSNMVKEDVEITEQVDAVSVFTESPRNVINSLDCSFVGSREQISTVCDDTIITVEEHYLEKMEIEEKISSLGDVQLNGSPNKLEAYEQLLVPIEPSTSKDPNKLGGQEQLTVLLGPRISDDAQVKLEQENQQEFASAAASTCVILSNSSAKLEMQAKQNIFRKRNNSKGFATKTKAKKKHVSTAEIPVGDLFSEELSVSMKDDQFFMPENDSLLNKIEERNIQRPASADGITSRHLHKSGKQRLRRRSHHRGYLLTARNLCKTVLFKKKTGRLRRMRKFCKLEP
ncbi:hypothetical protein IEQ34_009315 [Dendrobium chrysotoxum]|uniref:Uncharacterized protein n=1 Tax=Dendrobium chrysotoxum TaxID=161865 RepID=A0AAV7H0C5_DENCH|nr:hypothetical protein IEQ34_009315 [Dendrobium chrysotoxum]